MLRPRKIKAVLIFFLIISAVSGCTCQYDAVKQIEIQTNFDDPRIYTVNTEIYQQKLRERVDITVSHNGAETNEILLGRNKTRIEVLFKQQDLPFSLFKGHAIEGYIAFTAKTGNAKSINLPFQVYIKPWVITHLWILVAIAGVGTMLFAANLIARLFLLPASGRADIIYPNNLIEGRMIYPPSLINHFIRNRYTIGSGKRDQWMLDDAKFKALNINKGQISLRFLKRGKEKYIAIKSKKQFYYKTGEPQLKGKTSPAEKYRFKKIEKVSEYKVDHFVEDSNQTKREEHYINCGFREENKIDLSYKLKKVVLVYSAGDLVFQIEAPTK